MLRYTTYFVLLFTIALASCKVQQIAQTIPTNKTSEYYHPIDDSTLARNELPVLMPYNRIINPAGTSIRFGDRELENHSLDAKFIDGTDIIVVENRYGIVLLDAASKKIISKWSFQDDKEYNGFMSTYSGLQILKKGNSVAQIFWSAANPNKKASYVMQAIWDGKKLTIANPIEFKPVAPSPLALPNELALTKENGNDFLYVVLNGNDQLVKIALDNNSVVWTKPTGVAPYGVVSAGDKIFVTNWGGPQPTKGENKETAGVPYGDVYINPVTGATSLGTVTVYNAQSGNIISEINVGLHPNDIISSPNEKYIYVANGNSDNISVIETNSLKVVETIDIRLDKKKGGFIGDTPNALAIDPSGNILYVANGLDNAIAVVKLSKHSLGEESVVKGFIPTEAYPGGIALKNDVLYVTNLEGQGARVNSKETKLANNKIYGERGAYNSHKQKATLSIIPVPNEQQLAVYTSRVKELNLSFRNELSRQAPRKNIAPKPMPERIGEPSVFKHVVYIIKENRTYDQVLGDMIEGKGMESLTIFGDKITPNQHQFARDFLLLDNYYASGKCSAEGHQWTDAAMVTDYVEKNVRAWFRSYPHVQEDALVYGEKGFIWNNAADHGKTVRIYGEACQPNYDKGLNWTKIYNDYKAGKPFRFYNTSTISRVRPMMSQNFPGSDDHNINEQIRADAFIKELKEYEAMPGDQFPNLCVMALAADHTVGTRPGFPTPNAMVADNDLAVGRIVEAISKSRFWKSTVIFITEDDSQAGWDHVSAYRTTGFVISPYSRLQKTVSTNYNQTNMVRSIEQILGIPPMNIIDATAAPMFDCFNNNFSDKDYTHKPSNIPLNEMNPELSALNGKRLKYARLSLRPEFDKIDRGDDGIMNEILWNYAKGDKKYPRKMSGKGGEDDDD